MLVGIRDVLGYDEGNSEASLSDAVVTIEDGVRPVVVDEGLVSFRRVVHLTDNLFFCVAYDGIHRTIEAGVCLLVAVQHASANRCRTTGFQRQYVVADSCMVNAVHHDGGSGQCQTHGRVAQQRVLQFVLGPVRRPDRLQIALRVLLVANDDTCCHQFALRTSDSFTNGHHLSCLVTTQYLTGEGQIHQPVLRLVNGTCGTKEGYGATLLVE